MMGFLILLPAVVISTAWSGYVLSILWGWFIVPVFHLPALSIAQAVGMAIVIGMVTRDLNVKREDQDMASAISVPLVYNLLMLVIGWVVHQFT